MERNCCNCHHLRAKIPLSKEADLAKRQLLYVKALVFCNQEQLTKGAQIISDRIFKNVLRPYVKGRNAFKAAETCPYYEEDICEVEDKLSSRNAGS
jgi:hypothetical protein